jgi:ParB family transcriptional regulator, chromosome partitioning protein
MAAKKQKSNLFSGGLLANTTVETVGEVEQDQRETVLRTVEEDDPLFGNTKRILGITQKAASVTDANGYPKIEISKLDNNPYQPRRRMNQKRLEILAHEIQHYGFKGVLLARVHPENDQRFQLVYGHRRREASRIAGLKELPVMIDDTINDDEMKFLALNENLLRDDLTPLDEAYLFAVMLEGMTQEAVATRLGVSRGYVRNRTDILKAAEDVQDMVEEKPDTMKAVVYLKDVQEDDIRKAAIQALLNEEITINQTKAFIENVRKAKTTPETTLPVAEMSVASSRGQSTQIQEDAQKETTGSETAHEDSTGKDVATKPERTLIQQSKEQTEALIDKTKIETFVKYLHKYDQRLHNRQITPDERAALDILADVAKSILESHMIQ